MPSGRACCWLYGAPEVCTLDGAPLPAEAAQPKRIALLAYLAAAQPRDAHRRDSLVALLWPELDTASARAALSKAVFHLRKAFGPGAIVGRGRESLALDEAHLWSDVRAFDDAMAAGRREDALALYRAPFLAGFFVADAPEFERWVDEERSRRRRLAAEAAWSLAERDAPHDADAALGWARQATRIDDSERAFQRLIAMHDAVGDREGALREYERLVARLRTELDVEPSPETETLVAAIRGRTTPSGDEASIAAGLRTPALGAPRVAATELPGARGRRRLLSALGVATALVLGYAAMRDPAPPVASDRLVQVALESTASRAARSAFLAGEQAYFEGRFAEAVAAFDRATQQDSTFALAWLRLSAAAQWTDDWSRTRAAADRALTLVAGVEPYGARHIRAYDRFLRGVADSAEWAYRAMLAEEPNDREALLRLADLHFHWGPNFGRPATASRRLWYRALVFAPSDADALLHVARIAAMERDLAAFDSAAARLSRQELGRDRTVELRLLRAFVFGNEADQREAVRALEAVDIVLRRTFARSVATAHSDPRAVSALLIPSLLSTNSPMSWEQGDLMLDAQLQVAAGRWGRAWAIVDSARPLQADRALDYEAVLATLPGAPVSRGQLDGLRTRLRAPFATGGRYALSAQLRRYLDAMVSLDLQDFAAVLLNIDALGRLAADRPERAEAQFAARYRRLLLAEVALANGRPADAARALGAPAIPPDRRIPFIWSYPLAHERWLRALAAERQGRLDEAERWYATFPDPGANDLMYLPLALERRSAIAEARGEPARAAALRARLPGSDSTSAALR